MAQRRFLLIAFVLACAAVTAAGQAVEASRPVGLEWSDLPPVPGSIGLGGPFVGVDRGALIVAGGANFPDAPPWQDGAKVWHDGIHVLVPGADAWRSEWTLVHPLAYGAAVGTDEGLLLIGGSDAEQAFAEVTLLRWDPERAEVEQGPFPDLPAPTAFCAAARLGDWVLVVPGKRSKDATDLEPGFWGLDLSLEPSARAWVELPPCPGEARAKALAVVQADGFGDEHFHLLSGEVAEAEGVGGTTYRYLADAWRFDLEARAWTRIADLPRPAAAGTTVPFGQSHVLVLGGVAGREMHLSLEERTGFPRDVLAYHTITDTWVGAGELPLGVVTTGAVEWNGDIVIPTGEVRPGVRTTRVQRGLSTLYPHSFGAINYTVLVLYLSALVGMGWYFSRREKGTKDYFLAGRRIPWWAAGLSIYGTALSAITYLSVPAVSFSTNCLITPAWVTIFLVAPVVVFFFLPFYRRLDVTTAYEYLERRFGVALRLFGSLSFMVFQVGRMAIVVYLPALALSTFAGIDVYVSILIIGGLSTVYTVLGGIEAVVWTDVLQVIVLMGGMTFAVMIAIADVGGPGEAIELARSAGKLDAYRGGWSFTEMTTWTIFFGSFFQNFGPYASDQTTIQRYLTTETEKEAARSIWMNGILSVPGGLVFFGLGACLFAWFKTNPGELAIGMKTDEVFPLFVATRLPVGISGLVVAGVFAASMSSLDSSMHGIATAFTTDFYRRFKRGVSDTRCLTVARITTIAMGAVGTGAAAVLASSDVASIFFFFQKLLGLVSSGVAGIFILGVFTRRTTGAGALLGALAGTAVVAWLTWWTPVDLYLYAAAGITTCVVVGYVASLVLPAKRRELAGLTLFTR